MRRPSYSNRLKLGRESAETSPRQVSGSLPCGHRPGRSWREYVVPSSSMPVCEGELDPAHTKIVPYVKLAPRLSRPFHGRANMMDFATRRLPFETNTCPAQQHPPTCRHLAVLPAAKMGLNDKEPIRMAWTCRTT